MAVPNRSGVWVMWCPGIRLRADSDCPRLATLGLLVPALTGGAWRRNRGQFRGRSDRWTSGAVTKPV